MKDSILQLFVQLIAQETGLHIRPQDCGALSQKIASRMKALKLSIPEQYYQFLQTNSEPNQREWRELIVLLTTTESYFLRDKGQFKLLENVILPEIIEEKKRLSNESGLMRSLRIWSAGCSTGEEPYSLAILIQKLIPDWQDWNILILGTDINQEALDKAKQGIYSPWSFRLVDPEIQQQYFSKYKSEWIIDTKLIKNVKFTYGNLVKDDYPNTQNDLCNMDLILCRNVFVYFESQSISLVIKKFYNTLRMGGYLMTGHAELYGQIIPQFRSKIFPASVVYQRIEREQEKDYQPTQMLLNITCIEPKLRSENLSSPVLLPIGNSKDVATPLTRVREPFENILRSINVKQSNLFSLIPKNQDRLATNLIQEAGDFFKNKNYSEAIEKAEQVIELYPDNFEAYYLLAEIYANLGKYEQAIDYCQQALKVDSMSIFPYHILAHIAEEQGDLEGAKVFLKRIIYLSPSCISAYLELANIYNKEGNFKREKKMYTTSCEILKLLPPETPIEQQGKITASELLKYVKEVLLQSSNQ
ncbi:chemotaxis protein CheR [Oscillatoriales cyanobacterium USR001]|nr:chemotaxis protein CheR [Oscillatoriales cyanobacterium USR001]